MKATRRKPRENLATLPPDKLPPQDEGAERALLGCALVRDGVVAPVPAEAFSVDLHQRVWQAVLDLNAARGRAPDAYTVVSHLGLVGAEAARVVDLAPLELDPAGADVHAQRVVDAWEKRRALVALHGAAGAAFDPTTSPEEVRARLAGAMPTGGLDKARELVVGLPERAKADPGAAFVPQVLDALALLKRLATDEWQRLRRELKAAGVRVVDLDDELKKRGPVARLAAGGQEPQELVRNVVSNGMGAGWFVSTRLGWVAHRYAEARARVSVGCDDSEDAAAILGAAVENPWELVNLPFQPEYPKPGRRVWNRDAAQLAYEPAPGPHPTWDLVLAHCGRGLDYAAAGDPWCQANGVAAGGDYLRLWAASLVQFPLEPLPYLFFHGPQNMGKSVFHQALSYLMTRGYALAAGALTSQGGFNGELAGALLCAVEEVDLRSERAALTRLKDWVTSPTILIHEKGRTPFPLTNTTHWIQTANKVEHCPVLKGDTRITVVAVPALDEGAEIPRVEMERRLKAEAPAFLHTLLTTTVPAPKGRLRIPVLETGEKRDAMRANRSELEVYLEDHDHWFAYTADEVARDFHPTLNGRSHYWPVSKVARELLDVEANEGKVGAPRKLARALRAWFETGGRRPRYVKASEVLGQLEGECSTWTPQKAGKHVGKLVGSMRAVGVVLTFREFGGGTEWRLEPCRLDMRVIEGDVA